MNDEYLELKYLAVCMIYADMKNKNKQFVLDMVQTEFDLLDFEMEIISEIFDLLLIMGAGCCSYNYLDILCDILKYI